MSEVDVCELAAQLVMTSNHGVRAKAAAELRRLSDVEDEWMALSQDQGKAQSQIDRLTTQRDALQAVIDACAIYLKEGETPAQRIERDHRDALALMSLLAQEKRKSEALLEFAQEVRRTGDTRLASMAIAIIAKAEGQ